MEKKILAIDWDIEMDIEKIDTPPTEVLEENVFVDEQFMKNKDLIRMDMNIIQFPIFSKNSKRKINQIVKYYFNQNRDTYITVKPTSGESVPAELEEKVFIVLMQIMKERNMPQKFLVKSSELKNKLNLKTKTYYHLIRKSLIKLAETNYNFKNTLYSSEKNGVIREEISTPILNLRIITLSLEENKKYRDKINDNRVKEVYEINISEHFYKNIIQKGYMVYNGETLLQIDSSIARTIYMLIEKLRFNNLYLKLDTLFLIKRIPLKYTKINIAQTIKLLEKSLKNLIEKKLISNFTFIKESTWENSEIEIIFPESANEEKQERFFSDRNDFRKIITSSIKNMDEVIEEIEIVNSKNETVVTREMIDKVLGLMPSKAKELKTMSRTIKEAIEKFGYSKVESVAIYMKKNKVDKIRAYFIKALENNWIEDENISLKTVQKLDVKETYEIIDEPSIDSKYDESFFVIFEKLSTELQNEIENLAYKEYIRKCGMETKIQKIAFSGSRKKNICEYLEKNPEKILNFKIEKEPIQILEKVETKIEDINKIKDIITEAIELADMVFSYTAAEKKELLLKILKEVIPLRTSEKLTVEKLNIIMSHYIKL
ncbi:MAG: hypothetical protein ACRDAT_04180 [Cetobacterium sp.]